MNLPGPGMREAAARILRAVPLALWRKLLPKAGVGVCYHMISDGPVPHVKHYRFLDTQTFESDLEYLSTRFELVPYEEFARRRSLAASRRDDSLILTFDDGFAECATVVAPLLRRRGSRCTFFVITDLIDNQVLFRESAISLCIEEILRTPFERLESIVAGLGLADLLRPVPGDALSDPTPTLPFGLAELDRNMDRRVAPLVRGLLQGAAGRESLVQELLVRLGVDSRGYLQDRKPYLTREQLRELHADGFTIGAHSCSHRWLQDLSRAEAEQEIVESCRIVRELTGQRSVPFAFPYSGSGLDRAWLSGLRAQHDFIGLFFDTGGVRDDAPIVVQRVFGERFTGARSLDAILRRAWADPAAWPRRPRELPSNASG